MTETIDGVGEKAMGEFLSEAQEIVENLNRDILKLDDNLKRQRKDPELINHIFRSAHSLKGLSGMFGVKKMAEFAHALENLLDGLRMGKVVLSAEGIDLLFESVELFNRLIAEAGGGPKVAKKTLTAIHKQIEKLRADPLAEQAASPLGMIDLDPSLLSVLTEYEEYRLVDNIRQGIPLFRVHAGFDLMTFDESLARLTAELKSVGEVITTLPSSEVTSDQTIGFDILVGAQAVLADMRERVDSEEVQVYEVRRRDQSDSVPVAVGSQATGVTVVSGTAGVVEADENTGVGEEGTAPAGGDAGGEADDAPARPSGPEPEAVSLRSVSQTVRVDIGKLDSLMNIVGELVLVRTAIQSLSDQIKAELGFTGLAVDLYKQTRNFERKLDELQAGIMEVRMVPLGQNFEKLSRMVRKLSRTAGKEVELQISGADTELDKLIVEDLADPLMHIMRNSIDHGLEDPATRRAAGKSETGHIRVDAYQKGNHVVIEVADDGHGIDLDKVRAKALELGQVERSRLSEMTTRDLLNLLFLPGFSTSSTVSELSGRGVGLDVVKTNIANLSGMIDIHSELGKGTRLIITLPITLAIIRALIIRVREQIYAVPLNSVLEIISVPLSRLRTIERREVIELRGTTLPLLRLDLLFELAGERQTALEQLYVIVVGLAEHRLGIAVDGLIGQQDIVIKSLGRALSLIPGIAGATNLASQQTILVLDVGALIEETLARD